jgi:small subunit ribosomal protein S1
MAQPPRVRRRTPEAEEAPASQTTAASTNTPADDVDRDGPVQAMRRARPQPVAFEPSESSFDLSGLEALVSMDRGELDAMMKGTSMRRNVKEGERLHATVSRVTDTHLLVDIGQKADAQIDREELPDAKPGDVIEAFVVWSNGVETTLSTRLRGETASAFLDEAKDAGIPVEGLVASRNAGGFVVKVGETRAFCPARLIDRIANGDLDRFIGQTLQFLVLETGDKVVVSRRALQERDLEESLRERWSKLTEGVMLRGVVSGIQPFGIFVDCDGLEGLVPRSETATERDSDLTEAFQPGQSLDVRVMAFDKETRKLTFSLRDPGAQPWKGKDRQDRPQPREARAMSSDGESGFGTFADLFGKPKG